MKKVIICLSTLLIVSITGCSSNKETKTVADVTDAAKSYFK